MELGSAPPSSSTRCLTSSQVPVLPELLGAAKDKRGEYKIQDIKNPASISAEEQVPTKEKYALTSDFTPTQNCHLQRFS